MAFGPKPTTISMPMNGEIVRYWINLPNGKCIVRIGVYQNNHFRNLGHVTHKSAVDGWSRDIP